MVGAKGLLNNSLESFQDLSATDLVKQGAKKPHSVNNDRSCLRYAPGWRPLVASFSFRPLAEAEEQKGGDKPCLHRLTDATICASVPTTVIKMTS